MRSLLFVFLLSSSVFVTASATSEPGTTAVPVEEVKTTPPSVDEVKTTPPVAEEVKSTQAAEEAKSSPASEEKVKSTAAPEGDVKSTGAAGEEVKTTAAPVEEVKTTEAPITLATAQENKDEASHTTEQPKEEKKEEVKKEEKKEEDKKEEKKEEEKKKEEKKEEEKKEKKEEEKLEIFDKALLSDAVVGEDEKKHRKHELIKKVVKKMDLDGAITPEEIETIISGVPIFETKEEILEVAVEIESKPKKPLVMPRENHGPLVRPAKPDVQILPVDEKKPQILPFPIKFDKMAHIGQAIKSSFEKLRGGRGLINIERIDKIDVKVYTYEKKN